MTTPTHPFDSRCPAGWVRMLAPMLVFAAVAGCKKPSTTVPPLCAFDSLSEEERQSQELSPLIWLGITSPSVDVESMVREGDLKSACGQVHDAAIDEELFECPGFDFDVTRVETDPVAETDLIMSQAGDNRTLLWAATDELSNGEAEGAAAMTLWTKDSLEVHAVGPLRAYRQAARMRLHRIGKTPVLVVESDKCDGSGKCVPVGQVVPIINRRLVELPLWESGRGCIGRAQFELDKRAERDIGNGVTRRFFFTRSLELSQSGIQITDLIRMEDVQTSSPEVPARPYRKITANRPLVFAGDRLELEDEDIWDRTLRDHGQVDPRNSAPVE